MEKCDIPLANVELNCCRELEAYAVATVTM